MKFTSFIAIIVCLFNTNLILGSLDNAFAQKQKEKTRIAVFDLEGIGLSDDDVDSISNYLATTLRRTGKVEVINRGLMNLTLIKNDFSLAIVDNEKAVEAGKLLKVDKVIMGVVGKIENSWIITIKVIDVHNATIDTTISYASTEYITASIRIANKLKEIVIPKTDKVKKKILIGFSAAIISVITILLLSSSK